MFTVHTTVEISFVEHSWLILIDFNSFRWEIGESFHALPNMQSKYMYYCRVIFDVTMVSCPKSGEIYKYEKSNCIQAGFIKIAGDYVIFFMIIYVVYLAWLL